MCPTQRPHTKQNFQTPCFKVNVIMECQKFVCTKVVSVLCSTLTLLNPFKYPDLKNISHRTSCRAMFQSPTLQDYIQPPLPLQGYIQRSLVHDVCLIVLVFFDQYCAGYPTSSAAVLIKFFIIYARGHIVLGLSDHVYQ